MSWECGYDGGKEEVNPEFGGETLPSSAGIKNRWSCTSISPYTCLVKRGDKFNCNFTFCKTHIWKTEKEM
jgi:hypothetical protein